MVCLIRFCMPHPYVIQRFPFPKHEHIRKPDHEGILRRLRASQGQVCFSRDESLRVRAVGLRFPTLYRICSHRCGLPDPVISLQWSSFDVLMRHYSRSCGSVHGGRLFQGHAIMVGAGRSYLHSIKGYRLWSDQGRWTREIKHGSGGIRL